MYGIFIYIWLICMVNVGKHIPYMDGISTEIIPYTLVFQYNLVRYYDPQTHLLRRFGP